MGLTGERSNFVRSEHGHDSTLLGATNGNSPGRAPAIGVGTAGAPGHERPFFVMR